MATDPNSLRETIARTYPFQPAGVYEALERAVLEWLRGQRDLSLDDFYDEAFPADPYLSGTMRAEVDRMRAERLPLPVEGDDK
jgi:hypothetical protein